MTRQAGQVVLSLLAFWLIAGPGRSQEPELTAEQQKLREEASELLSEGVRLYRQSKLPEATEKMRKSLELAQQVYPSDKYPRGHPDLAPKVIWLAVVLRDQGEYAKAEPLCRRAVEINEALYPKEKHPLGHPDLARSLYHLALLLRNQREYAKAEPLSRRALEMHEALYPKDKYPQGHPELVANLHNVAKLLEEQGEYPKAEALYRRALEMQEALYPKGKFPDGHPHLATTLLNLAGLLYERGEDTKAEPVFRRALEMNEALHPKDMDPNGHPHLAESLNGLAALLQGKGEYAQAEPLYRLALEMQEALYPKDKFPDGHPHLARSVSNLGSLLDAKGEYGQAELLNRRALEMRERSYPEDQFPNGHDDLVTSVNNLAFLLQAQGKHGEAEPLFRRALKMERLQIEQIARTTPEATALNYAISFPLTRDGLLSATRNRPETDGTTYETVWHSKSAVTRVFQRRHLALIAAATDPVVRKDWDTLQSLRRRREQLVMAPAGTPAQQTARRDTIDALAGEIDKLELSLLPRLPALKHSEDIARQGPGALQKLLPEDAVLIDILRYTHFEQNPRVPGRKGEKRTARYLAFLVSRTEVRRVELETAPDKETAPDIDAAVREWREAITLNLPAGHDAARKDHEAKLLRLGRRLRELVWMPVQKNLPAGVKAAFLVPDGVLAQLPWAALPGRDEDTVLLDDYALVVLPHGPALLEWLTPPPRAENRPPAPDGLLLIGGVSYDDKPSTVVASRGGEAVVGQKVSWGYLKGSEAERQLIEKLLAKGGVKVAASLGGTEAATERLRQELERVRYAHLGTHGFFADKEFRSVLNLDLKLFERTVVDGGRIGRIIGEGARSPLVLSGLVCAGANLDDTPDRGILSADAIAGLLLDDLHLTVLSACDTGLGDVAGGEGVFGLQRAFHIAGCKNVVASLWKVDDAATAALMTRFYGYLFHEDKDKRLPPIEALRRAQLDLYRHPELIPAWSKGESRAPGKPRPATTAPPADTPKELLTTDGRAPIKLWASFTLSGLGH